MSAQSAAVRLAVTVSFLGGACTINKVVPATDSHAAADHAMPTSSASGVSTTGNRGLPPDASGALARLNSSPRHGEWVTIRTGGGDSVRAWVAYPERSSKAPVVLVVHEIFGLSSWVHSVADQLAADGFIAIAPDLLTMKNLPDGPDSVVAPLARAVIGSLDPAWVQRQLDAVAQYGMSLPAADLESVRAPVLGLYGGSDARVDATIPPADSALRALGRTYVYNLYPGAGHGFLRQQTGMDGANMAATRAAWPATIAWFKKYLGS